MLRNLRIRHADEQNFSGILLRTKEGNTITTISLGIFEPLPWMASSPCLASQDDSLNMWQVVWSFPQFDEENFRVCWTPCTVLQSCLTTLPLIYDWTCTCSRRPTGTFSGVLIDVLRFLRYPYLSKEPSLLTLLLRFSWALYLFCTTIYS